MKKQLLAKIKDFQNKTEKEEQIVVEDEVFADEFNKSLNFLSNLSKQRKIKPSRNETLKNGKIEREIHLQIATELPEEMKPVRTPAPVHVNIKVDPQPVTVSLKPVSVVSTPVSVVSTPVSVIKNAPLYSNLKNGTRPTYRQYHNTTQKIHGQHPVAKPLIQIITTPDEEQLYNAPPPAVTKQRFKKRITRTLKYSLGKHKNGKVSVLIKNAMTRRKIQTEQALLKQKSIADIKVYLRGKNLLKVGSDVPNDVLRQLYENAILAGDVTNKSKDTLIHNYFNDK